MSDVRSCNRFLIDLESEFFSNGLQISNRINDIINMDNIRIFKSTCTCSVEKLLTMKPSTKPQTTLISDGLGAN